MGSCISIEEEAPARTQSHARSAASGRTASGRTGLDDGVYAASHGISTPPLKSGDAGGRSLGSNAGNGSKGLVSPRKLSQQQQPNQVGFDSLPRSGCSDVSSSSSSSTSSGSGNAVGAAAPRGWLSRGVTFVSDSSSSSSDAERVQGEAAAGTGSGVGQKLQAHVLRAFTYRDMKAATRNFPDEGKLGEGGFGCVYKGQLADGTAVAVKKLKCDGFQGEREWMTEVKFLGQLRHPHLVRLVGFCSEGKHRMLVYDYMPRGSLERWLFTQSTSMGAQLTWDLRMKVALDAAKGLALLHDELPDGGVIYRDFKASNVLLDENFNARLSDFGLAKDGPGGDKTHVSTRVMGTHGYAAPEYIYTGHLTVKSDIYSFGVVLLELICGRRALEPNYPRGEQSLVEWARTFLGDKQKMLKLADGRLQGRFSPKALRRCAVLAQHCLRREAHLRPTMTDAVKILSTVQGLFQQEQMQLMQQQQQ